MQLGLQRINLYSGVGIRSLGATAGQSYRLGGKDLAVTRNFEIDALMRFESSTSDFNEAWRPEIQRLGIALEKNRRTKLVIPCSFNDQWTKDILWG